MAGSVPPRLALATLLAGLCAVAPASASCQTERCHEQAARSSLEHLATMEREIGSSNDPQAWRSFFAELGGELAHRRAAASYEARLRWELPLILADPGAAEAAHAARLASWRRRWSQRFPESAEPWCSSANRERDLDSALELLDEGLARGADAEGIADCRALVRSWRGAAAEVAAELEAAIALSPEDPRLHDRLVKVLGYGGSRDEAAARTLAIERRARLFPESAEAQTAWIHALVEAGRADEASALVLDLLDDPFDADELQNLCYYNLPAAARLACLEAVLAAQPPGELTGEARFERDNLHGAIRQAALKAGDVDRAVEALRSVHPESRVREWSEAMFEAPSGLDLCPALREEFRSGMESPDPESEAYDYRGYLTLLERLSSCGSDLELRIALERLDPGGSGETPEARLDRLQANASSRWDGYERYRAMLASPPATRLPYFVDLARQHPEEARYAVEAARAHDLLNEVGASARWYEEAIRREPEKEPDLRIRKSELFLRHGELDGARREARAVAALPNASPRNRAEADYFLGRVERLEGDPVGAIARFERYFLLRHRFDSCATCDRPLLLQLFELGDRERLARYLAERGRAIDRFESELSTCRIFRSVVRRCPSDATSTELELAETGGCRFLASTASERSPGQEEPVLLPACPESWSDRSLWFRDDQVLRVYDDLMDVD